VEQDLHRFFTTCKSD